MGYKMSLLDKKSVFLPSYGKMFQDEVEDEDEVLEMVGSYDLYMVCNQVMSLRPVQITVPTILIS